MLPQWSLPTGLHSPSVNISGARPMTSHDGCQLETDDSGAYHLSFSPVRRASFTAALMGFSSSLDIIPCCTLPSPWNIRAWGGGCCLARAWECQHLEYPGEQGKPTPFLFLLFSKGAEKLPRPCCPVFGRACAWSWS